MKIHQGFLMLLLGISGSAFSQQDSVGKVLDIGNNSDYEGYDMLDSLLLSKQIFITGELDDYPAFNSKLEFKMLRYMNYKAGLRNYMLEISPAKADIINQYIVSEDSAIEKLLQSVSQVKYMRLYKNLKRLNSTLPDSLKIRVFGVDVERSNSLPVVKMSQYLPEDSIPDDLRIAVEAIEGAAKFIITKGLEEYDREVEGEVSEDDYYYRPSAFSVSASLETFLEQYDSLAPRFENWLGAKFTDFNLAVEWLLEYNKYNQYSMTALEFTWREEMIFNRVNSLLALYPHDKFYGQFQMCRSVYGSVPEGCKLSQFSGLMHKLKTYPESLGKDAVSLGLFYSESLENDYEQNKQHNAYAKELNDLFEFVPNDEVAIINPGLFDSTEALKKDFTLLILNHNYEMAEDIEDVDTAVSEYDDDYESDWYTGYRNSRFFAGVHLFTPYIKLQETNAQLKAASIDTIESSNYLNGELAFASDEAMGAIFYSSGYNLSGLYRSSAIGFKVGNYLLFKRFIKWGFFTSWAYVRHEITEKSNALPTTYFTEYNAPRVFVNTAATLGLSTDVYIDFAPFYIFASGGKQWDLGNTAWKNNGNYTGSKGGLSNTAWFTNFGAGLSIPLRWVD